MKTWWTGHPSTRRFYESLGAKDVESKSSVPPGGGTTFLHRYVWLSAQLTELATNLPE